MAGRLAVLLNLLKMLALVAGACALAGSLGWLVGETALANDLAGGFGVRARGREAPTVCGHES